MVTKSLPTFKHTSIGAKTHKAGTATAHLSYIMRSDAMTKFQAENMPGGERGTRVFFDRLWEKAGMQENARIADKLMIALPIELNREQRYELVRSFMRELGQGRIPWCAAHHDMGKDANNPHAHILFKDADIDTGRKVVGTTTNTRDVREAKEHGWKVPPRTTTADMRKKWCEHLNRFMERAGIDVRYDARTLKEQGVKRDPQIHIGPKAQALDEKDYDFSSRDRSRGERSLPYTLLDEESRAAHNAKIRENNRLREKQAPDRPGQGAAPPEAPPREDIEKRTLREAQRQARKAMYAGQKRDRDALGQRHEAERRALLDAMKPDYSKARTKAYKAVGEAFAGKWKEARSIEDQDKRQHAAAALKAEQRAAYEREKRKELRALSGPWKKLLSRQTGERSELWKLHQSEIALVARQHIAERLGVHEKWRARRLDGQAGRIDAQLSARQGMAAQQSAALKTMKLHARTGQTGNQQDFIPPANPREAAKRYFEIAREEDLKREAIRQKLFDDRMKNLEKAAQISGGRTGRSKDQRDVSPSPGAPSGHITPREIIAPGIEVARDQRLNWVRQRMNADPQDQIRQAAASGQTLTGEQRANAGPELREQLAREDKGMQERSAFRPEALSKKDRGQGNEGRSGGGRGR